MTTPFPRFPFVVLDTEATGFFPRSDRVLELAIVRYEEGEKVAEYASLYQVHCEIPPHVQVLTRIRPADLQGKPLLLEEKGKVEELLQGALIVGHNIPYDLGMLTGEGVALSDVPWIDTAMLASLVFPELPSWSLGYLSAALALPHTPKHRALGDVYATLALFALEWEKLRELPKDVLEEVQHLAERGPEGYALLFSSLKAEGKKRPSWLSFAGRKAPEKNVDKGGDNGFLPLPGERDQAASSPTLLPVSLSPSLLPRVLSSLSQTVEERGSVWIAVKNLEATLRMLHPSLLTGYAVLRPPSSLLNPGAKEQFLVQGVFTAYELTLALKLLLFAPRTQRDAPLHAEEMDVWKAKVACTEESAPYRAQFSEKRTQRLIDQQHLLDLLSKGEGPTGGDYVIVDDASMLEDTATKAFRWIVALDVLRAGAEGNASLTRFLDLYQLWAEKVRNFQSIRYLVEADLKTPEVRGVRERLEEALLSLLTDQVRDRLEDLQKILDPKNLEGRIVWIEQFRDGGQTLQSVPFDIATLLRRVLYDRCRTLLLLPPGEEAAFRPILLRGTGRVASPLQEKQHETSPNILYPDMHLSFERLLKCIDSKVIALVPSKRTIEQLFVSHAEELEKAGVTLIAQGLSGGQGRMQAEFLAAKNQALWLLTPWMYEGSELPPGSVDHLWIHTLPFDHPSHAILSRRADQYANPFEEYFLPRLLHRLFRIVRTYALHRTEEGDVLVLDARMRTKEYGVKVRAYLSEITAALPSHGEQAKQ